MTHEELVAVIIAKVVQAVPDYPEGPIRTVEEIG